MWTDRLSQIAKALRLAEDSAGYFLLETMLSAAITATTILSVGHMINKYGSEMRVLGDRKTAIETRLDLVVSLNNEEAIKKTLADVGNANSFACIQSQSSCDPQEKPFRLVSASGEVINDHLQSSQAGFNGARSTCDQFAETGNATCAHRYELTWIPICTSCADMQFLVRGRLKYQPGQPQLKSLLNESSYAFEVIVNIQRPAAPKIVNISSAHVCGVMADGGLKCFGFNSVGQLGLGDTLTRGTNISQLGDALPFVQLPTGLTVLQVAPGMDSTCALLSDSTIRCWGDGNRYFSAVSYGGAPGTMGDALPALAFNPGQVPTALSSTSSGIQCAAFNDGHAWCWGAPGDMAKNGLGGVPRRELIFEHPVLEIAAGGWGTCVRLDRPAPLPNVKCFGPDNKKDYFGQGGLGTNVATEADVLDADIKNDTTRFADPSYLGFVNLGGVQAKLIRAGDLSACAILTNDTVTCWGRNEHGELGQGTISRGNSVGGTLINFGAGRFAVDIAIGERNGCALLNTGEVMCWGESFGLTPTLKDLNGRLGKALAGGLTDNFCVMTTDDLTLCWTNSYPEFLGWTEGHEAPSGFGKMSGLPGDVIPHTVVQPFVLWKTN